jgi:hypothetical protein
MGRNPAPQFTDTLVQLVLRGERIDTLIQNDRDWHELGVLAARTLFWRGGAIYACRCEGNEIRFAIQVAHASLGSMAHHISGAYAIHLRNTRGLTGATFKHYSAIPLLDEMYLDELVFWLHRSTSEATVTPQRIWTADDAYLKPGSLPWVSPHRVLASLSFGAAGPLTYRRRKSEPLSAGAIDLFTRRPQRAPSVDRASTASTESEPGTLTGRPSITRIARLVADFSQVPYEELLTDTRKRVVSKARVIATVLATRNGATAAAAARLFNRSRSSLIEQVEHYRATQPELFAEAESILDASVAAEGRE